MSPYIKLTPSKFKKRGRVFPLRRGVTGLGRYQAREVKPWRANLVLIFIFLFGAAIIGKLFFLQVLNQNFYQALAQGQHNILAKVTGSRGEIYIQDKDGNLYPAAVNESGKSCLISIEEIKDKNKTLETLSQTLDLNYDNLLAKVEDKKSGFLLIKENLSQKELQDLENLKIEGVELKDQEFRKYPYYNFASHIIGFVNKDGLGQYGIEENQDDVLKGKEGLIEGMRGPMGYLFLSDKDGSSSRGADLILTIDYNIQFQAEKLLDKAQQNLKIREGQIIVINPNTGKILALAHLPRFDPNSYYQQQFEVFQNGAIQKLFEPGSVFKPITMAAALDQGRVDPQTTYIDKGKVEIGGYYIENYNQQVWGKRTMTEVLEKSINTGAVFVQDELGPDLFLDYIKKFGFFEKTGIDLAGETYSQNQEIQKGYKIGFATASFGQGIEVTPIQLIRAYAAIANGGKLIKPYLVEKIKQNDNIIEIQPKISDNNVISLKTSSQLTAMLVSVVKNGFAKSAQIPGYYVAGKTGTGQISLTALGEDKEGYSNQTWQSFAGFVPAFNPQFLILVKLDNPQTRTAEYSAVPIFHDLAKYIVDYWQIPPNYE